MAGMTVKVSLSRDKSRRYYLSKDVKVLRIEEAFCTSTTPATSAVCCERRAKFIGRGVHSVRA